MTIDFDLSFVLQMALFATLIVVLKPLLFDPVLQVFEARERMTDGSRDAARAMQVEAGELLQRYERELERVHEVARAERERMRAETARLEAELMRETRASVSRVLEEGRARIAADRTRTETELKAQSTAMARLLAETVLGRGL
jgi:F-type H+-transporting ATPase subunit b